MSTPLTPERDTQAQDSTDGEELATPELMKRRTGQRVGGWFLARYIIGQLGIWIAVMTPASVTLAIRVGTLDPNNKAASLSLIAGIGAIAALLANPIAGRLSDRSISRFGQRRPFILGGMLVGIAATFVIGSASSLLAVGIGWFIAQAAFNTALSAMFAVLPERVPSRLRGRVSAFMGSGSQIGAVGGTFLVQLTGTNGVGMFLAPAVLGLLLVGVFIFGLREDRRTREEVGPVRLRDIPGAMWINPLRHRDFALAWMSRFLLWLALALLTTYKTYYLVDHVGLSIEETPSVLFIAMLILASAIFVSSVIAGWLSDIVKRRKPFVFVAAVVFASAMLVIAFSDTFAGFLIGVAIAGIGQGSYMGVDYALVSELLPDSATEAAKGMGVFALSASVPQAISPGIAPLLLGVGSVAAEPNYVALYIGAAMFALLASLATLFIRKSR